MGPRADLVTLTGEPGPDGKRHTSSHRHDAVFDPSGPFLAVSDLGFDRIFVFRLDAESGKLNPNDPPFAKTRPGRRPQAHRLSSADAVRLCDQRTRSDHHHYRFGSAAGQLAADPGLAIHSGELQRRQHGAEIAVAPSGGVVYASNRGHDSIVIFAANARDGTLTPAGWALTHAK